jgi:hypothetical protein
MLKILITLSSAIIGISLISASAMAAGYGVYGSFDYGGGITAITHNGRLNYTTNGPINNMVAGGGVMVDTNVLGDSVFNYRLKIGGDQFWNNGESDFVGADGHIFNSFGFRLYGNNRIRLWAGPGFGFRYITGKSSGSSYWGREDVGDWEYYGIINDGLVPGDPSLWIGNYGLHKATSTYSLWGVEAGLVFGMNVAVTDLVIITAEVAAKYVLMFGNRIRNVTTLITTTEQSNPFYPEYDYSSSKENIISHCGAVNITLGILFRWGREGF